jgi:hypothetical protein
MAKWIYNKDGREFEVPVEPGLGKQSKAFAVKIAVRQEPRTLTNNNIGMASRTVIIAMTMIMSLSL